MLNYNALTYTPVLLACSSNKFFNPAKQSVLFLCYTGLGTVGNFGKTAT